ncbi:hypothetical protein JKP88DRAFT_247235 [Tribonema minus]|uniref:RWP-RK domain-containing protein n=1 Tax=Tribonema minus TaxID=303371 RepID=A0A835YR47_9STRA|nr:hypothetical protein JKP88DRAFT_247235 [Tribonema minus]
MRRGCSLTPWDVHDGHASESTCGGSIPMHSALGTRPSMSTNGDTDDADADQVKTIAVPDAQRRPREHRDSPTDNFNPNLMLNMAPRIDSDPVPGVRYRKCPAERELQAPLDAHASSGTGSSSPSRISSPSRDEHDAGLELEVRPAKLMRHVTDDARSATHQLQHDEHLRVGDNLNARPSQRRGGGGGDASPPRRSDRDGGAHSVTVTVDWRQQVQHPAVHLDPSDSPRASRSSRGAPRLPVPHAHAAFGSDYYHAAPAAAAARPAERLLQPLVLNGPPLLLRLRHESGAHWVSESAADAALPPPVRAAGGWRSGSSGGGGGSDELGGAIPPQPPLPWRLNNGRGSSSSGGGGGLFVPPNLTTQLQHMRPRAPLHATFRYQSDSGGGGSERRWLRTEPAMHTYWPPAALPDSSYGSAPHHDPSMMLSMAGEHWSSVAYQPPLKLAPPAHSGSSNAQQWHGYARNAAAASSWHTAAAAANGELQGPLFHLLQASSSSRAPASVGHERSRTVTPPLPQPLSPAAYVAAAPAHAAAAADAWQLAARAAARGPRNGQLKLEPHRSVGSSAAACAAAAGGAYNSGGEAVAAGSGGGGGVAHRRSSEPASGRAQDWGRSKRSSSEDEVSIDLALLRTMFDLPITEAAQKCGVCLTAFKKICRKQGIKRWPHRQIKALQKAIRNLEDAASQPHLSQSEQHRYETQIQAINASLLAVHNGISTARNAIDRSL